MNREQWRTKEEFAAELGINPHTFNKWSRTPGFPRGRRWVPPGGRKPSRLFRHDAVQNWLLGCAAAIEIYQAGREAAVEAAARKREAQEAAIRQTRARLAELIEDGATWAEIADDLRRTVEAVRALATKTGLVPLYQHKGAGGIPRRDSDECVDALLCAAESLHDGEAALTVSRYNRWRLRRAPDAPSSGTITKMLGGTWAESLRMVGLDPAEKFPRRRWSDEELLDALKRSEARSHERYNAWRDQQTDPTPSTAAFVDRFGGWIEALRVIGRDGSS